MSVDIISQRTNTLPSGFKITFTVGRIAKDAPHSLPPQPQATNSPAEVTPPPSSPGSQSGDA